MAQSVINVRILGDNKNFRGALDDAESQAGKWAGRIGKAVAAGAALAGAAAGAALIKGFGDATAAEANADLLEARLGITPERAAELAEISAGVYRDAWGESLEGVSDAVAALDRGFPDVGAAQLEALSVKAIAVGDVFDTDIAQSIQSAEELVSSGLAGSAEEAFDLLTAGLQRMPAAIRDELFAASNEYGDFFADLGFTGNEAFGLLTDFADQGVFGIDKVGDAIKELSIRATDGSTATTAAYDAIGISAGETAEQMLAGGDDARNAFFEIVTGLQGIEDPVLQANSAIALFGTPLEDLSVGEIPEFLDSLNNIDSGMGNVTGAADKMTDAVGSNARARIKAFRRQALGKLADFVAQHVIPQVERFTEWAQRELPPIMDRAAQIVEQVAPRIRDAIAQVVTWIRDNWPTIKAVFDTYVSYLQNVAWPVIQTIMTGIITAVGAVVDWVVTNWPKIRAAIAAVVDWFQADAWPVIEKIVGFIVAEFENLQGWVDENWPKIKETIESTIEAIRVIIDKVLTVIQGIWERHGDTLIRYLERAWAAIKKVIGGALEIIRGVIQTVTSLIRGDWSGAWDGIKAIVDGAWQAINGLIDLALAQAKLLMQVGWDTIKEGARIAWDAVKSVIRSAIGRIVTEVTNLPKRLIGLVGAMLDAGKALGDALLNGLKNALSATAGFAGDVGRAVLDAVKSVVNRFVIDKINAALEFQVPLPAPFGSISVNPPDIPRLHSGGPVGRLNGPPSEIPALLQQGEYVLSRDDVRSISAGRGRRFPQPSTPDSATIVVEGQPYQAAIRRQGDFDRWAA